MDMIRLTMAGINAAEGISRFGGIPSLYEKYLNKFPEDENYRKLEDALFKKDAKEAFSYCHALKGLSGNLSMKSLYDAAALLTEELRVGSLENADKLFEKVRTAYQSAISAIS